MTDKKKEKIKEVILDAFPESNIPAGSILNNNDNMYSNYEGNRVKNFFSGKKYTDITLDKLNSEYESDASACLFFMNPGAALYYLASFLMIVIDSFYESDLMPYTVMHFISGELIQDEEVDEWFSSIYSQMSVEQKNALIQFTSYIQSCHSIDMPGIDFEGTISKIENEMT